MLTSRLYLLSKAVWHRRRQRIKKWGNGKRLKSTIRAKKMIYGHGRDAKQSAVQAIGPERAGAFRPISSLTRWVITGTDQACSALIIALVCICKGKKINPQVVAVFKPLSKLTNPSLG